MRMLSKYGLILAVGLLGSSAVAAQLPGDDHESITVPGARPDLPDLTGDLDPSKAHFDGLTGQTIARDILPEDRSSAFQELANSLTGPLGKTYEWHGPHDDGVFIPTREYDEAGLLCRDFWEQTDHRASEGYDPLDRFQFDDRSPIIPGSACRESDGWHFR